MGLASVYGTIQQNKGAITVDSEVVSSFGHSALSASDGKEAVGIYRKKWKEIDLVMLDMMMPNMNGKDAFCAMKKINPDLKVIIASGYSQNEACDYILAEGGLDFIQKPFDITKLNNAISEASLKIKVGPA